MTRAGNALHAIALAAIILTAWYGVALYPHMPDTIPVHFNAAGEADRLADKSFGSVFGALATGAGMAALMLIINILVARHATFGAAERAMNSALFGYINASMAALFTWVSIVSWNAQPLGPWFIIAALLVGLPVFAIFGVYYNRVNKERATLTTEGDPSTDPRFWRAGMIYRNPADARLFVPRPPQWGLGATLNMAHPMARLFIMLTIVLIAVPIALVIWL